MNFERLNRIVVSLTCALLMVTFAPARPVQGEVALLMEEPYGQFGAFNPTGHAAVYLSEVCAETPTRLRRCHTGEYGAVVSRYHKIHGRDWIAMPLVAYLYAVETVSGIPVSAEKADVTVAREAYWRAHLRALAPPAADGGPPGGEWTQLVGSSFDRKIYGFSVDSTPEQDDRMIALLNDKRNVSHFNLFFHNCADFSRVVLDTYYPAAIHRNLWADFGMTTPKQAAHSMLKFGEKHPDLHPTTFAIAQVAGTVPRSHPVRGIAESLVKSKKYLVPLAVLQPLVAGAIAVDYLATGRSQMPQSTAPFDIQDWLVAEPRADAAAGTSTSGY